jgi:hypothetical protein
MQQKHDRERENVAVEFVWRDKALEVIIKKINQIFRSPGEQCTSVSEYFGKYDSDMDGYLTPT